MADFRYELLKGVPFVKAKVLGRHLEFSGRFIVDTGSYMTIVRTPRLDAMGYSAREDATGPFKTSSVIGEERGYCLKVKCIEVFGRRFEGFEVAALDLSPKYRIDGLIGMNLLNLFDWCVHPNKQIISVK